jgi:hypothetical protein
VRFGFLEEVTCSTEPHCILYPPHLLHPKPPHTNLIKLGGAILGGENTTAGPAPPNTRRGEVPVPTGRPGCLQLMLCLLLINTCSPPDSRLSRTLQTVGFKHPKLAERTTLQDGNSQDRGKQRLRSIPLAYRRRTNQPSGVNPKVSGHLPAVWIPNPGSGPGLDAMDSCVFFRWPHWAAPPLQAMSMFRLFSLSSSNSISSSFSPTLARPAHSCITRQSQHSSQNVDH